MDRIWVKDLQVGQRAVGTYVVARKQQATGKNGKTFLKLLLQDKTGQVDARVWNDAEQIAALFEAGDRVLVEGQVGSFQRLPQLTIERLEKAGDDLPAEDFAYEAPARPAEERRAAGGAAGGESQYQALRAELVRVSDPHVRALLLSFLDDPEVVSKLRRAPASREANHAYPGGLLEHILSCVRLAARLADHYPMADRDLLLAGSFLRDIGKTAALSPEKGGGHTDEGLLVGSAAIGAAWIRERAGVISGFPKELELHLMHLVLADGGSSDAAPKTLEAHLVHAIAGLDAGLNAMLGQMAKSPGGGRWTQPQKAHESQLWKAPAPTEGGKRRGAPAKGLGKQRASRKERDAEGTATGTAAVERPRKERAPRERGAERPGRDAVAGAAPDAAANATETARPQGGGERRGPKILKPAGAGKAPPAEKLTFKPFSAFTGEGEAAPEAPALEPAQGVSEDDTSTPAAGFPADQGAPSSGPEDSVASTATVAENAGSAEASAAPSSPAPEPSPTAEESSAASPAPEPSPTAQSSAPAEAPPEPRPAATTEAATTDPAPTVQESWKTPAPDEEPKPE